MNVEPGYTTTEFWVTCVTGVLVEGLALASAFGLPLTPDERMHIIGLATATIPFLAGLYALGRGIRKHGQ